MIEEKTSEFDSTPCAMQDYLKLIFNPYYYMMALDSTNFIFNFIEGLTI